MAINIHAQSKKGRNSFFRDLKRPVAARILPKFGWPLVREDEGMLNNHWHWSKKVIKIGVKKCLQNQYSFGIMSSFTKVVFLAQTSLFEFECFTRKKRGYVILIIKVNLLGPQSHRERRENAEFPHVYYEIYGECE